MFTAQHFCLIALLAGCDASDEALRQESEKLRGDWEVTAKYSAGIKSDEKQLKKYKMSLQFQGEKFLITESGRTEEYAIKLDCTKTPKRFVATLVAVDGKAATDERPDTWAYEVNVDSIRVACRLDSPDSPTRIDPEAKSQLVFIAQRKK